MLSRLQVKNLNEVMDSQMTFGERIADKVARFGGSWTFIISFGVFLLLWMGGNSVYLLTNPPDPFPFIFLNLILSCIAALQAPVIMMSQNRQAAKDRLQADQEFEINVKAEIAIQQLHRKLDELRLRLAQQHPSDREAQRQRHLMPEWLALIMPPPRCRTPPCRAHSMSAVPSSPARCAAGAAA